MDAPRLTPPTTLELDRFRHVRFDMRSVFQAERALCALWGRQINILTLFGDLNAITLNDLSVLLHQGLRHEDPSLTLEETQDLMTFDRLSAILNAVFDAWNAATRPALNPEEDATSVGPLSSLGGNSGATDVLT